MKLQIRQSVYETNSSSAHTFTVTKRESYMHWKLEDYKNKTIKICDPEWKNLFNSEKLQNQIIHTSGCKLVFLLGILAEHLECSAEFFVDNKLLSKDDVYNLPFLRWLKEEVKALHCIDLDYESGINTYPYLEEIWFDMSTYSVIAPLMREVLSQDENLSVTGMDDKEIVRKVLNDEDLFKSFVRTWLTNDDIVVIDEYEEW